MNEHFVAARHGVIGASIDSQDNALRTKLLSTSPQYVGILHGGGIERCFVSTSAQCGPNIFNGTNPSTDSHGNEHLLSRTPYHIQHRSTILIGGRNIQEYNFVGPFCIIIRSQFNRVTSIAQIEKVDPFDDAALGNVQ